MLQPASPRGAHGSKASNQPCAWLVGACTCCEGEALEVEKEWEDGSFGDLKDEGEGDTNSGSVAVVQELSGQRVVVGADSIDSVGDPFEVHGKDIDAADGLNGMRPPSKAAAPCVPWLTERENTRAHHRQEALLSASLALLVLVTTFGTTVLTAWLFGLFKRGDNFEFATPCRDYERPIVPWNLMATGWVESSTYQHTETSLAWFRVLVAAPAAVWLALHARTHHLRIVAAFAVLSWAHQVIFLMYLLGMCDNAGWVQVPLNVGAFATFLQVMHCLNSFFCAALVLKHLATLEAASLADLCARHLRCWVWYAGPVALIAMFALEFVPSVPDEVPGWIFLVWWLVVLLLAWRSLRIACGLANGAARNAVTERAAEARRGVAALRMQAVASVLALLTTLAAFGLNFVVANRLNPIPTPAFGTSTHELLYLVGGLTSLLNVAANAFFGMAMGGGLTRTAQNSTLQANAARKRRERWSQAHSEWRPFGSGEMADWDRHVHDLAGRGLSLAALLQFYRGLGNDYMLQFDPARHTTTQVVQQAVIPMTAEQRSSCAVLLMKGEYCRPSKMVTHCWSSLFRDLVASVIADALEDSDYSMIAVLLMQDIELLERWIGERDLGKKTYWLSAFAVNQHLSICNKSVVDDNGLVLPKCPCRLAKATYQSAPLLADGRSIPCEMNKLDDMLRYLAATDAGFEHVIAVDAKFKLFTRVWCAAEIVAGHTAGAIQRLKLHMADDLPDHQDDFNHLNIEAMESWLPEDKEQIVKRIEDVSAFNKRLQSILSEDLVPLWSRLDCEDQMVQEGRIIRWHQACMQRGFSTSLWDAGKRS